MRLLTCIIALFLLAAPALASTSSTVNKESTELHADEAAVPASLRDVKAGMIMVYKSERRMDILDRDGNPIRTYKISLGKDPVGDKVKEGDNRTPEGKYIIDTRNENSQYHKSLRISYPNPADKWRAKKNGVNPGGGIFIHGLPNGKGWQRWKYNKDNDWTNGCIGVYNFEIREIWDMVPDGTPIIIKP